MAAASLFRTIQRAALTFRTPESLLLPIDCLCHQNRRLGSFRRCPVLPRLHRLHPVALQSAAQTHRLSFPPAVAAPPTGASPSVPCITAIWPVPGGLSWALPSRSAFPAPE